MALVCQSLWTCHCCKHTWPFCHCSSAHAVGGKQWQSETHLWTPRMATCPWGWSSCSQATSTPRHLEINFSDNIRMFKALKPQCFVLLSLSENIHS